MPVPGRIRPKTPYEVGGGYDPTGLSMSSSPYGWDRTGKPFKNQEEAMAYGKSLRPGPETRGDLMGVCPYGTNPDGSCKPAPSPHPQQAQPLAQQISGVRAGAATQAATQAASAPAPEAAQRQAATSQFEWNLLQNQTRWYETGGKEGFRAFSDEEYMNRRMLYLNR